VHHPILHYIVTHVAATSVAAAIFRWRGFTHHTLNGQDYYHRRCRETDPSKCLKPLVFISGIGIGTVSYVRSKKGARLLQPCVCSLVRC
jgi:hypothetical protein